MEYKISSDQYFFNPKPLTTWNHHFTKNNAFNSEELKEIENMVKDKPFKKGLTIGQDENDDDKIINESNYRKVIYIDPNDTNKWLFQKLITLALEANVVAYNFDIQTITDPLHYVVYPKDGGHLDWHMDIGTGEVNNRKMAVTVQLSNRDEYEGGHFQIWRGGDQQFLTVSKNKGDAIIFPSFLMHRVTPITKGERKALVFWVGGTPFK
jgi:PKHD-type hydroxylase